ncbi:CapA family protein [[Phormidium] sp. LEGE 05292]|uniref:CapA family protein n=1 Tax=[Phormidium] sp. LEGE 05292 TaxID=767427 RepID=UPI002AD344D8|nr:CapA family protein [Phormidium sp. LEGE 05292]
MTQVVLEPKSIITLAQEGNPEAIATLINQVIAKKGVTAIAKSKDNWLHIVLVAEEIPDRSVYLRFIIDGIIRLNARNIDFVRVYGRKSDHKWPSWTEAFDLAQTPYFPPIPHQIPAVARPPEQRKPKPPKYRKQFKKKIRLLLMGGVTWLMVAVLGVVFSYQINSPVRNKRQQLQPLEQRDSVIPETQKPTPQASKKPTAQATPKPAAITLPAIDNKQLITLKAVGDIVPGTNFPNNKLPQNKQELFQNVKPYLQGADILFGNFESTLTNYPNTAKDTSRPMVHAFRTPPEYAQLLQEVGFTVMSVANNHSFDFTIQGFEDTIKNLENAGVRAVGKKNQILYKNIKGTEIAFIAFSHLSWHNSLNDLPSAIALVKEAQKKASIVIISVHGGAEGTGAMRVKNRSENFYGENRGNLVLFCRTLIDNGADLVLGHGPHVARAMELYKGKLIAYSLGNFVGYRTLSTRGVLGESLILEVQLNSQGDFISGKITPVQLDRRGIPYPDKGANSIPIIRNLTKLDFPQTALQFEPNGHIIKVGEERQTTEEVKQKEQAVVNSNPIN